MKRVLLVPLIIALAGVAHGDDNSAPTVPDQEHLQQRAIMLMEDVVPHVPVSNSTVQIYDDQDCAICGPFFGDGQIGALVAVRPDKAKPGNDADLCLLLWKDGWKFAQWAGKVQWEPSATQVSPGETQNWIWGIKQRAPDAPYYVISSFDVNGLSYRDHFSWLCDPKTHSLLPTSWPKNAIPSLSGDTITFQRCEKSGYAPMVFEIDEFDGKPGKNLATYSAQYEQGRPSITLSMPDSATGKRITWRIVPATAPFEARHARSSLCYSPSDVNLEPFHEDATVDVQWGEDPYPNDATNFLIWRLTGIERNAQMGIWDEDATGSNKPWEKMTQKPARAVVTGIPEAVKAFSWPLNPASPVSGGDNSK
jgi:hypothetical protein